MKLTKLSIAVVLTGFLAGCPNPYIQSENGKPANQITAGKKLPPIQPEKNTSEVVGQPVEELKFFNQIAPARIPVQIFSRNNSTGFSKIQRVIEGNIANAGYEVTDEKPFLSVAIQNGKVDSFDKLGNYYVIKSRVELTVYRDVYDYIKDALGRPHLLSRVTLKAKGKRILGREDAIDDSADKLAAEAAKWTRNVCIRELKGLDAVKVKFPADRLQKAFGYYSHHRDFYERCLTVFMRKVAAKDGIFYCQIVGRDSNYLSFEVLYRKKDYPNGPFAILADLRVYFKGKTPEARVDEFLGYVMR